MAEIKIAAKVRSEFGKGAARRARRDGLVPAVIYGHGEKPIHIALPAREVGVALKTSNVLLDIDLGSQVELTLPKSVVRDPIKGTLEHIDLILVRRGERVVVSVPVHTFGKYDQDGILEHVHNSIEVEVEATSIPAHLELDMEGLVAGDSLFASNVKLPDGVTLVSDPKMVVVHLSVRAAAEEVVATPAAEGAAEGGAETPAATGDAAPAKS